MVTAHYATTTPFYRHVIDALLRSYERVSMQRRFQLDEATYTRMRPFLPGRVRYELQRRIQFDAISLSFIGTALITFGWGFAEGAGAPQLRAFAVWPIMGTLWGLGVFVAQRRYPCTTD